MMVNIYLFFLVLSFLFNKNVFENQNSVSKYLKTIKDSPGFMKIIANFAVQVNSAIKDKSWAKM